ncbi:MAG TPA: tetratricopeptide repeat protein [Anaerolineae bacterium]|nr:tetratricopeptide repeat protein [Anaerolineae bacterium]
MRTKIGAFCDAVIEAGWLLALLVVPLFFNVHSNRNFEPDKLGLLRSIATIMVVAWLIKLSEQALVKGGGPQGSDGATARKPFLRIPLVLPTLLLGAVYLVSTAVSVAPRISLWGSYQRLQGTYTTLSYIVVFCMMLQGLRRREQVRRLLTTIIVTSLPISLYGLMQHYRLDPLPWAGDVTSRVASNLGNAIFVAAYLIMVVPITVARIIQLLGTALGDVSRRSKLGFALFFWLLVAVQMGVWAKAGFPAGVAASLMVIVLLTLGSTYYKRPMARFVLLGCYGAILTVQLATILFAQSRGAWLGMVGGLVFFFLLYLFSRGRRRAGIGVVGASAVLGCLLVLVNLKQTPFPGFRSLPYVGRLGRVLDFETGTGKVRALIWEGAVEMIEANPLRALIGYGPETMFVAYNPFYPPELAHYEARTASPDRAHNETFDTIIFIGLLGLVVSASVLAGVFYHGLRWLGLIRTRAQQRLFLLFGVLGALLGVLLPLLIDRSFRFLGLGLPLGFLLSMGAYVTVSSLTAAGEGESHDSVKLRLRGEDALLVVALLSGVVAHLVEIQVGIAIAATRTYFWAYAALMALLGERLVSTGAVRPSEQEPVSSRSRAVSKRGGVTGPARVAAPARKGGNRRRPGQMRRQRRSAQRIGSGVESIGIQVCAITTIMGLMMATLAWDYATNPRGETNPLAVIWSSLTSLAARGQAGQTSLGMAWLVIATFVISLLAAVCETVEHESEEREVKWWLLSFGAFALGAGGIGGLFACIHAARLGPRTDLSSLVNEYYLGMAFVAIIVASILYLGPSRPDLVSGGAVALGYPALILLSILFIQSRNMSIIKADTLYKQGLMFDNANQWDQAIQFYQRAVDVAPTEDFYQLFRGRALMERARLEQEPMLRDVYFQRAVDSLTEARRLNPLNTDNTWNLGRLYRAWGELSPDPAAGQDRLRLSTEFYAQATELSPQNAQIYNEWGDVCRLLGDLDQALVRYKQSEALDQEYAQTYFLLGDLHLARQEWREAIQAYETGLAVDASYVRGWTVLAFCYSRMGEWSQAIEANLRALELVPEDQVTLKNLAACYAQLGQWDKAIQANARALRLNPDDYYTLKNLSLLHNQVHREADALSYAERALAVAPEQEKEALEAFVLQLRDQVGKD